ncbi:Ig-like domain-containing protein [Neobacillus sp. SAB-20_R2A]|uniref:Ig-like domain-containing protein n=1 Tax=Neobacillus sp. SAB-20_R2A TaxID=3120519 RepID=UPI003C6E9461
MKSVKKVFVMFTVIFTLVMTIIPPSFAMGVLQDITTKGDTPANWPEGFAPYTNSSGVPIFDPASDVHPIDVDITSGVDRGIGNLPSMYVASDDTNFFVRLRLKGNPYDRKGGFLSSVWFVKVAVNGEAKATIGLDGKSPHTDYVYIANADGTNVQPIYKTTADGSTVPGTRITPAENGHYFLDFQVPISRITDMVPSITASTPVQFFFGSSKAANLSVINKDWMNPSDGTGNTEEYSGLASVSLNTQYLTVSIDGGNSKQYSTTNNKVTGRSSLASGTVSLVVNNTPAVSVPISNHSWSYDLPSSITANNGIYKASATVTESGKNSAATQDIMILDNSDTLLINGGANAITNSKTPVLSGIYAGSHSNNVRIRVYIDGNEITPNTGADRNTTNLTWTQSANLVSPYDGKAFSVRVDWTDTGNKATLFATATQQLTYKEGITLSPVSVNISPITGDAKPVISGTSGGSDKVEVRVDGKTVEIAQPDSSGNWKVPALEQPLSIGNHIVSAIVRNSAGNTAIDSEPYTVSGSAITIDNGLTTASNDPAPTIRGNTNAADGSKVTITIDNSSKYEAIVKNGRWEIQVPNNTPLFEGIHTVAAAVNNVSASQQLTIDTTTIVEILTPDSTTKDGRPLFSGTAELGATVELLVAQESGQLVFVKNLQADSDGKWQFTPTDELPKGSYQIRATASDLNGNDAEKTSTFTITEATVSITKIDNITRVVDYGTSLDDAVKALGSEVIVYLQDGKTSKVGITWSKTAEPEYKGDTPGSYVFKGALGMLPVGVDNNNLIPVPTGTVTVKEKPTVSIKSVTPVEATVANGTTLEAAKSALGSTVPVTLENGVTVDVPITWSPKSTPAYDGTTAGKYVFTGTFGSLSSTIDNLRDVAAPSGTVEVLTPQTVSIEGVPPITKIVPIETGIDEAKKALGNMVAVNLAGGGSIDIPVTWSEVSVPNYDGHNRGEYVFDGTFGPLPIGVDNHNQVATPKGTIKIYSNAADITAFSFAEETKPAQINAVDKTILAEVKNGTSLEQLKASFTLSQYARGANISEDSQVSGITANNFSTPVTYTVTAEDGTKQD